MSAFPEESFAPEPWLELVRRKASAIRFGSVQITVHEGRVTVVEAIEKTRIDPHKCVPAPAARRVLVP